MEMWNSRHCGTATTEGPISSRLGYFSLTGPMHCAEMLRLAEGDAVGILTHESFEAQAVCSKAVSSYPQEVLIIALQNP